MSDEQNDNQSTVALEVYNGTIIWFSNAKGFGFIGWEKNGAQQRDMFVHYSDIQAEGYKSLFKNQSVQFSLGTNKNGDPKAVNVKIITN